MLTSTGYTGCCHLLRKARFQACWSCSQVCCSQQLHKTWQAHRIQYVSCIFFIGLKCCAPGHWTFCDDRRIQSNCSYADPPSYMMALELRHASRNRRCLALLKERTSATWPRVIGTRGAPDMRGNGGMGEQFHEGAEVHHQIAQDGQVHSMARKAITSHVRSGW